MAKVSGGPVVLIHEHVSGGGLAGEVPASWLAEGSAMRQTLARDFAEAGARVVMTLDARLPDEPGPWTVRRIEPGSAFEAIAPLAARADFTIPVAPETGGILRDLASAIDRAGGRSLGSTPEAIDLAADKLRMAAHVERAGILTAPTRRFDIRLGPYRDATYPAVLKPIDGAGALDTLYIASSDDPILATFPDVGGIWQPFLQGRPRSASFFARSGSPPLLVCVGLQEIAIDRGRFTYLGGTILTEDLPSHHPSRLAVASVGGLSGLVGVDYLHDPSSSEAIVIEINPRPTTSCVGLVAALGPGRLAAAWLEIAAGRETVPISLPARPVSFRPDGSLRVSPPPCPFEPSLP